MTENNVKITDFIYDLCEKQGAIEYVDAERYKMFLELSDSELKIVIKYIIIGRFENIRNNLITKKWTTEDDIFKNISIILYLIARGIIKMHEDTGKLLVFKPVGDPPDEDTNDRLDRKTKEAIPIMKEALKEILDDDKLFDDRKEPCVKQIMIESENRVPYYTFKGFYYWDMKRERDQIFDKSKESVFVYDEIYLVVLGLKGYWMLWYEDLYISRNK